MSPDSPRAHTPGTDLGLGLVGGAVGGAVGYFVFGWLVGQGFYAVALPGVLLGIGAGKLARNPSRLLAVLCAAAALGLGLFSEWRYLPFVADASLGYFLQHLQDLKPVTWIMVLLGAAAGYWFAWRGPARVISSASTSSSDPR